MNRNTPLAEAYLRADGTKGIRNRLLVLYTVECARHVAHQIATDSPVDAALVGSEDCAGNQVVLRQLLRFATHPNVGAVLAVGMGCETLSAERIAAFARESGRPACSLTIQSSKGSEEAIALGLQRIHQLAPELDAVPRTPLYACDLVVGAECGGSDYTSGLAANPLVGCFFDWLSDLGGIAVAEELHEAVGLKEYLVSRGADASAQRDIALTYEKMLRFCKARGHFSISPGNHEGGLTTIEEKSMGAVAKTGCRPIAGVLKVAQKPSKPGVWLLDVCPDYHPETSFFHGGDASAMMNLAAAGCQLIFLTSGLGHVAGNPLCPVFKITGNAKTYQDMAGDIDFSAAPLLDGDARWDDMLDLLFQEVRHVLQGRPVKAELVGGIAPLLPSNNQHPTKVLDVCYDDGNPRQPLPTEKQ